MAGRKNLFEPIIPGTTFAFPLKFMDHGEPMSIEGRRLVFMLKLDPSAPDESANLRYEVDLPDPDPTAAEGDHMIILQGSDTGSLAIGNYHYEVQLIDLAAVPEPKVVTYLVGCAPVKDC